MVLSQGEIDIPQERLNSRILNYALAPVATEFPSSINLSGKLKSALAEVEYIMIREGLERCFHNKSKLAEELGISRSSLISKISKYELDKKRKKLA